MFSKEGDGYSCSHCTMWIQDTGNWFCEECNCPTCSRCGVLDHVDGFLCPDCFSKPPKEELIPND
jgi:hypothetical protein